MSKDGYYIEYDVDLSGIDRWEKQVIELLKAAVEICGSIYARQCNPARAGAGFYPLNVSRKEIEEASSKNQLILSPYTKVIRNDDESLMAIGYSEAYKDEISNLVGILRKSSTIYTSNGCNNYASYLQQLADDLLNDNYDKSENMWLSLNGGTNVDIRLGPIETYQDKLFGVKKAFQANLRIRCKREYRNVKEYIKVINALQPLSPFSNDESGVDLIVRVDTVVAMGGWHAELVPRGSNYTASNDGGNARAKILIYSNNIERKHKVIHDVARTVIESSPDLSLGYDRMARAAVRYVTFHEIAEVIACIRYRGYESRLGSMADVIRELYSYLIGVKSASVQVLKGVLTTEEYRDILVNLVATAVYDWVDGKDQKSGIKVYSDAYLVALNFFRSEGAINVGNTGKIMIKFEVMYSSMEGLLTVLSQLLSSGTEQEAERFYKENSSTEVFERYESEVKKIIGKR